MDDRWRQRLRDPRVRIALVVAVVLAGAIGFTFARFAGRVDALRARHASGPAWSFPSRVYADGVVLEPGRLAPTRWLLGHLAARGYRRTFFSAPDAPGEWTPVSGGFEVFLRGFRDAPDPDGQGGPERVQVRVAGGRIAEVHRLGGFAGAPPPDLRHPPRLEPVVVAQLMDEHRVRRTWVPLSRVPQAMRDAVVAAEDRRFYRHIGLDLRSSARALVSNVRAGGVREGGSTITQQLARGLFLGSERTFGRKLAEMWLAIGLELVLSKDQILEMYLNSAYWGQGDGGGIAGVAEAARWYFDAPVESLTTARAALLAGLIPSPNTTSPFRNRRVAQARRNAVLADLVATGRLPAVEGARLRRLPLDVRRGAPRPDRFPSFAGYVREALADLPAGAAEHWGLAILTSMDLVWQQEAERELADGVSALERWRGRTEQPLEGAFVALDPSSGRVRALVGGRAPRAGDFNRAIQARRQPGSAIKPIVYAAALDARRGGRSFSPATVVPDLRREFATPEGPWSPRNDDGQYHESVTLAKALAKSLNVATANLVEALGPGEVARYGERFGLGRFPAVPSIGLGTHEVTLLSLTAAYATFPNRGARHRPSPLRSVRDGRGHELLAPSPPALRVIPARTAALMTGLLEDVVIFGVSYPLRKHFGFTRPVGGKTGTTNDYLDAWFVGFTPELVAGVWIGYDEPRSLARPAAETALPVWAGIVSRLVEGAPHTSFPDAEELDLVWIDPWTGGLPGPSCPGVMRVPFLPGTAPRRVCERDHSGDWESIWRARAADSLGVIEEEERLPPW